MRRATFVLLAVLAFGLVAGCVTDGVDDYQRAMGLGCTPSAAGLVCSGR